MIKEVTMYTVVCDGCGVDAFKDQDFSCWSDSSTADEFAQENDGWIKEGEEHFCGNCWSYNETDDIVVKRKEGTNG